MAYKPLILIAYQIKLLLAGSTPSGCYLPPAARRPKAIFRDALIQFYHTVANGEERKENLERKFEELFSMVQEHHEQNQAQFKSLQTKRTLMGKTSSR